MATIRKRVWTSKGETKTAWVVDYKDQNGNRRLKTFAKKKDADTWATTALYEVRQGTHTPESASTTVGKATDLWIERAEAEGLERTTVDQYRQHDRYHIRPMLGGVKLARLTTPAVEEFVDRLRTGKTPDGKPRSPALTRKVLTSLKSILSDAQRRGLVSQNVARSVKIRIASRHKARVEIPSKDEIRAILDAATGQWRPLLVTAVFTGMRASELRGLTWADVDIEARQIHVRRRADRFGEIGNPKSAAGSRDIPMTPLVLNTLREWRLQCARTALDLVFPNADGGVESHANIFRRGFRDVQVRLGIVDEKTDADGNPVKVARYSLHALRHFYASWLIDQGFAPKRVQALLGHQSIQMTYDTYGHLFPADDDYERLTAGELAVVG